MLWSILSALYSPHSSFCPFLSLPAISNGGTNTRRGRAPVLGAGHSSREEVDLDFGLFWPGEPSPFARPSPGSIHRRTNKTTLCNKTLFFSQQFLAALDLTIVVVALPKILEELHGVKLIAWVLASYLLTSASVQSLVGRLSDVYGRRMIYMGAVTLFFIGSALCGTSTSIWYLIIARGVQGLGGGGIMGLTQTIVAE